MKALSVRSSFPVTNQRNKDSQALPAHGLVERPLSFVSAEETTHPCLRPHYSLVGRACRFWSSHQKVLEIKSLAICNEHTSSCIFLKGTTEPLNTPALIPFYCTFVSIKMRRPIPTHPFRPLLLPLYLLLFSHPSMPFRIFPLLVFQDVMTHFLTYLTVQNVMLLCCLFLPSHLLVFA